jgi:hypothetical protein
VTRRSANHVWVQLEPGTGGVFRNFAVSARNTVVAMLRDSDVIAFVHTTDTAPTARLSDDGTGTSKSWSTGQPCTTDPRPEDRPSETAGLDVPGR